MPATLKSNLGVWAKTLPARMDNASRQTAEAIADDAREGAVGERLPEAIHVERVGFCQYNVVAGTREVFWGHFQERGTVQRPAEPFLTPAVERQRRTLAHLRRALRAA